MVPLLLVGLAVLVTCCALIDAAGRVSLDAAAAVYAIGLGGAVMALVASGVLLNA